MAVVADEGDEGDREALSQIIQDLNTRFNTAFTEDEIDRHQAAGKKISEDQALQQQLKNGSPHAVQETFRQVAQDAFEDLINENFKFYKKVSDDEEVSKEFFHGCSSGTGKAVAEAREAQRPRGAREACPAVGTERRRPSCQLAPGKSISSSASLPWSRGASSSATVAASWALTRRRRRQLHACVRDDRI
jgi:cation transport regulator ChaB